MAWHLHDQVIYAIIDNRIRGQVTGQVWLAGRAEPLRLELQGNAWSDLAGRRFCIDNPWFRPAALYGLATLQRGVCGHMTRAHHMRKPNGSTHGSLTVSSNGEVAILPGLGVFLEWFSDRNGQVIIELPCCGISLSEPVWAPTPEERAEPSWCNLTAVREYLGQQAHV